MPDESAPRAAPPPRLFLSSAPPRPQPERAFAYPVKDAPGAPFSASRISFSGSPETFWTDHLAELEEWAKANQKDARNDTFAFWALKVPAIIASASAGIWAHFELTTVSVIAGAIASVCVIVDGIHPRGMLRNTHLRAFHDIRILISRMVSQFRSSDGPAETTIRTIIRGSEAERERIAAYIRDAETALKPSDKG